MAVEKELLEGIALMTQGKEEGFNIFYSRTHNFVYGRARAIMKNETDAQDLTQETFIQAYKGIASLKDANHVYAWLGGIVFRQGAKLYNKTKKELLVNEDQSYIFEDIATEDADTLPEESAQLKATSEVVMSMIDELPELQRSAIISFYYDHMKIEEIANVFDCSANTIKSRLNYAKKFLKGKVEENQKQYHYKLYSLSPAILLLALRSLLASEKYTMTPATMKQIYQGACSTLGISASSVAISASATAATTATATTASTAKGLGLLGKFAAFSAAKKAGIIILATTLLGGGIATAIILANNNKNSIPETETFHELKPDAPTPMSTNHPLPTATPMPDSAITSTPSPTSEPEGNRVHSIQEYYSLLGDLANTGITETQIYLSSSLFDQEPYLNDVPELQRYAGINVSLVAEYSKIQLAENSYQLVSVADGTYNIVNVRFQYGETEIAAYSEEDYWDKFSKAIDKRMERFTIYISGETSEDLHRIANRYPVYEAPPQDIFEDAVCYHEDYSGSTSYSDINGEYYAKLVITYHVKYIGSNAVRADNSDQILSALQTWYEGERAAGFTIYLSTQNGLHEFESTQEIFQEWFDMNYPNSGYYLDFAEFPHDESLALLYVTCTPRKIGEPISES